MFSNEQIAFMSKQGIKVDFSAPLSDDDFFKIDNIISSLLQTKGFDEKYEPTNIGKMCESILDVMADM